MLFLDLLTVKSHIEESVFFQWIGIVNIKIIGTEEKNITGEKKIYFVLQPVSDKNATIYAPVDNAVVLKKMRKLLTKDEIYKLIDTMPEENAVWVDNENERKELYKSILAKGDHMELIKMKQLKKI